MPVKKTSFKPVKILLLLSGYAIFILILLLNFSSSLATWQFLAPFDSTFSLLSHFKVQWTSLLVLYLIVLIAVPAKKPLVQSSKGLKHIWHLFKHQVVQKKRRVVFAALIAVMNGLDILIWYVPPPVHMGHQTPLKILYFNAFKYNNRQIELVKYIQQAQPDMVILLEVNSYYIQALNALDFPHHYIRPDKHQMVLPAIWSKYPLQKTVIKRLKPTSMPFVQTQLKVQSRSVNLISAHMPSPFTRRSILERNQQLSDLAQYLSSLSRPVILTGDLNISIWSSFYKVLEQQGKLVNTRKGSGIQTTWPVLNSPEQWGWKYYVAPWFRIPIDHALVSKDISPRKTQAGPYMGSDHLPLMIELKL